VLDVGFLNGSQHIRLLETSGQVGKWVALTYCWGNVPFLQTTSQNIESLKREIVFSSLPQTFKDAVIITRQLGIRYLWIDALCIQQDSDLDWQAESANMPAIYTNAYLTIAAVGAQNSHQGMLNPRGWVSDKPDSCSVRLSRKSVVDFRMPINHLTHIDHLSRRAWCLQEKVLSPRVLSFGSSQMTFTCSSTHLTEGNYVRDAQAKRDLSLTAKNELYLRVSRVSRSFGQNIFYHVALRKLHRCWYGILTDYTQRTLTFPRDKLIAISGVADYIRRETSYEYLAGIWKESLPQALLWQNPPSMKPQLQDSGCLLFREKVRSYRAPSWSWAAVDGPVHFGDCVKDLEQPEIHRLSSKCQVLECEVQSEGVDCGQVLGGYITIHGPLRMVTCKPGYASMHYYEYNVAVLIGDKLTAGKDREWGSIREPTNLRDCLGVFDVRELPEGRTVWCLQVTTAFGLLLVPSIGQAGTFHRVGKCFLRCVGPERYVDWFKGCNQETVTII
jgi:hypothetical protein